MSLFLSQQEIVDLTKRVRYKAQARQLAHLKIPAEPRTDGSLVVLRIHVDAVLKAASAPTESKPRVRLD